MCVAIPARINSILGTEAEVDIGGNTRAVSLQLTPEARVGDYVIIHTGYAISVLDQREGEETLRLIEAVARAAEEEH